MFPHFLKIALHHVKAINISIITGPRLRVHPHFKVILLTNLLQILIEKMVFILSMEGFLADEVFISVVNILLNLSALTLKPVLVKTANA